MDLNKLCEIADSVANKSLSDKHHKISDEEVEAAANALASHIDEDGDDSGTDVVEEQASQSAETSDSETDSSGDSDLVFDSNTCKTAYGRHVTDSMRRLADALTNTTDTADVEGIALSALEEMPAADCVSTVVEVCGKAIDKLQETIKMLQEQVDQCTNGEVDAPVEDEVSIEADESAEKDGE